MTDFKRKATFENAVATAETTMALLVKLEDHDEAIWTPKSQIDDDSEVWRSGDEGKLVVSEWIAREKGWI